MKFKNYNKQACKRGVGRNFYSNEEALILFPSLSPVTIRDLKRQNYIKKEEDIFKKISGTMWYKNKKKNKIKYPK